MATTKVNISLKNKTGESVTYEGIDTIQLPTVEGNLATFILKGTDVTDDVTLEQKEINPDFSNGDQIVESDYKHAFYKVTIKQPENLVSENIMKDVTIAGITGTASGGNEVETYQDNLTTGYGSMGAVIVEPDYKTIRIYGEHKGDKYNGTVDIFYKDDLSMLKTIEDVNSDLKKQVDLAATALVAKKDEFNNIFSSGEAVRVHGVICSTPSITDSITTWNDFMNMLYSSIQNVSTNMLSSNFVDRQATFFSGDTSSSDTGWTAKFPFEWESVNKVGEQYMAGYEMADPTIEVPTYDNGQKIVQNDSITVGVLNANTSAGITSNVFAVTGPLLDLDGIELVAIWYSYGAQTLSETLLKSLNSSWNGGDITLSQGWNITGYGQVTEGESDKYKTEGDASITAELLNVAIGQPLGSDKIPYDDLDDYMKSMFAKIYKQDYKVIDKFLLEYNLTHKKTTD